MESILVVLACVLMLGCGFYYIQWRKADYAATKWLKYAARLEAQRQRHIARIENFEDMQAANLQMSINYAKALLTCESIIGSEAVEKVRNDLIILQRVKETGVDRWIAERSEEGLEDVKIDG